MKVIMESSGSYILSTETSKKFLSYTVHVSQILKNKSKVKLNLAFTWLIQLDEIMIFRKDESKKDYKQHLLQIIILL